MSEYAINEPYCTEVENISELNSLVNKEIGLTKWREIIQLDINTFGKLTNDEQWIHVDVARAHSESPFGKPVAHGFMILSYASAFVLSLIHI